MTICIDNRSSYRCICIASWYWVGTVGCINVNTEVHADNSSSTVNTFFKLPAYRMARGVNIRPLSWILSQPSCSKIIILICTRLVPIFIGPKSNLCIALPCQPSCWNLFRLMDLIEVVKWIGQNWYVDFSKLLYGFFKIGTWISLSCFMDFFKINTWISLSCYMDLSKLHGFIKVVKWHSYFKTDLVHKTSMQGSRGRGLLQVCPHVASVAWHLPPHPSAHWGLPPTCPALSFLPPSPPVPAPPTDHQL